MNKPSPTYMYNLAQAICTILALAISQLYLYVYHYAKQYEQT